MLELPAWVHYSLRFAEGEEGGGTGNEGSTGGTGSTGGDENHDGELSPEELAKANQTNQSLLDALKEERRQRQKLERESKTRTKAEEEAKLREQGEVELLKKQLADARDANSKLGSGYLRDKMNDAIREEARRLNFIDPADALALVDRAMITTEQDEDNPAVVAIDEASLKKAVKQLADARKHLIKTSTDDGEQTGSSFGGSGSGGKKNPLSEEELRKKYPNL